MCRQGAVKRQENDLKPSVLDEIDKNLTEKQKKDIHDLAFSTSSRSDEYGNITKNDIESLNKK